MAECQAVVDLLYNKSK